MFHTRHDLLKVLDLDFVNISEDILNIIHKRKPIVYQECIDLTKRLRKDLTSTDRGVVLNGVSDLIITINMICRIEDVDIKSQFNLASLDDVSLKSLENKSNFVSNCLGASIRLRDNDHATNNTALYLLIGLTYVTLSHIEHFRLQDDYFTDIIKLRLKEKEDRIRRNISR